ncbi:polysialyltransferase family glycosyltransferase [Pseudohalioglobus lutimaris]|uniref:Uncharacterized protein n=1 Tax=Pseudohalioglobus lutimaris TaxID=1737061 RepID=A0A2N5X700_9GAMM|nr:polysialyltransferase family glycosyltransferase [Pseudohalioglobus lutimaris]PLW70250.1 hypothetical protein C0039_03310 [Pseudohalioglobus lutimaris]
MTWRREKCVIFMGYTPNNAISIGALLDHFAGADQYCFLSCDRRIVHYADRVAWLSPNMRNRFTKFLGFLLASLYARVLLLRYRRVSICLPHPDHLLGNFLFFHPQVDERCIFEDGILNYYDAVLTENQLRGMMFRHRFGWLIGLKYTLYEGFLSGIDARQYDRAFVSYPEKMVRRESYGEVFTINRYHRSGEQWRSSGVILMLDQNIELLLDATDADKLRKKMARVVEQISGEVLIKPHYDMRNRQEPPTETWVAAEYRSQPAELIIDEIKPKAVVSFCSSALINIKELYPEVQCVAVGANYLPVQIDGVSKTIADIFSGLGIEVVAVEGKV